jgi:hypothetical protein
LVEVSHVKCIFIWLCLAIFGGILASKFKRSAFGWFVLACIISPLIAGLLLIILGKNKDDEILEKIRKLKKAQQDYVEFYCANEETVKSNLILQGMFSKLSQLTITGSTTITVEEVEKYTNMLLMDVARVETTKISEIESTFNENDNVEDHF